MTETDDVAEDVTEDTPPTEGSRQVDKSIVGAKQLYRLFTSMGTAPNSGGRQTGALSDEYVRTGVIMFQGFEILPSLRVFCEAVIQGNYMPVACAVSGHAFRSVMRWLRDGNALDQRFTQIEEEAEEYEVEVSYPPIDFTDWLKMNFALAYRKSVAMSEQMDVVNLAKLARVDARAAQWRLQHGPSAERWQGKPKQLAIDSNSTTTAHVTEEKTVTVEVIDVREALKSEKVFELMQQLAIEAEISEATT